MIATDGRYRKDLVAGDVKAAAFGAQTAAELLVTGGKGHLLMSRVKSQKPRGDLTFSCCSTLYTTPQTYEDPHEG